MKANAGRHTRNPMCEPANNNCESAKHATPILFDLVRFDFEAGGRKKWKPVAKATGAFVRVTPIDHPTGMLVGPVSKN